MSFVDKVSFSKRTTAYRFEKCTIALKRMSQQGIRVICKLCKFMLHHRFQDCSFSSLKENPLKTSQKWKLLSTNTVNLLCTASFLHSLKSLPHQVSCISHQKENLKREIFMTCKGKSAWPSGTNSFTAVCFCTLWILREQYFKFLSILSIWYTLDVEHNNFEMNGSSWEGMVRIVKRLSVSSSQTFFCQVRNSGWNNGEVGCRANWYPGNTLQTLLCLVSLLNSCVFKLSIFKKGTLAAQLHFLNRECLLGMISFHVANSLPHCWRNLCVHKNVIWTQELSVVYNLKTMVQDLCEEADRPFISVELKILIQ